MAGSNQMGGVHYAMITFIFLFLATSVGWFLTYREQEDLVAKESEAKKLATQSETGLRNKDEEVQELKKLIGHNFEQVGVGEPNDNTKVLGAMLSDIRTYGGDYSQATYRATIIELRKQLDSMTAERDQLLADKADLARERDNEVSLKNDAVAQHQQQVTDIRADLNDKISTDEERIASKQAEIDTLRVNYSDSQLELERQKEINAEQKKAADIEIADLTSINEKLNEKIDEIVQVSFETPDGEVRWVDNATGVVWINLGSEDQLSTQTTFSVYDKSNEGVGRGPQDIKGSIEVTRILGPHLSQARILKEDIYRPMVAGDEIYTPVWEPGRKQYFSFVGFIDLDDDGLSDRELLHDVIKSSGGEIDNEVDDDGNVTGSGITVDTKFLIIGELPDPTEASRESERERMTRILQAHKELVGQARKQAVRKISLNDFLNYIGYEPKRRLFIPGLTDKDYNLKAGSRSTATNEPILSGDSSGQVSGRFSNKDRTNNQNTSSGQTSSSFGGGGKSDPY